MRLDSVRELKANILKKDVRPLLHVRAFRELGMAARATSAVTAAPRTIAVGIFPEGKNDYKLAVRVQNRALERSPAVEGMVRAARGEVDIRHIGRVAKRVAKGAASLPWHQREQRPLLIGSSVAHHLVTAGTLGCFVRNRRGQLCLLSNNHVLANENDAAPGDVVTQPGNLDGGRKGKHKVAVLERFIEMKPSGINQVDAAVARLLDDVEVEPLVLKGLGGRLEGLGPEADEMLDRVAKIGRTTGVRRGRVTAFELNDLVVEYDFGNARFDNQIEIEGIGGRPFSLGGDSGSLVVDYDRLAIGLLFAGSDQGGRSGKGLTYVHPIRTVLRSLRTELVAGE